MDKNLKTDILKENMIDEEILKKKIREYIPKEKIVFYRDENNGLLSIKFLKTKSTMSILEDNTWEEIIKHINTKIKKRMDIKCVRCETDELKNLTCPKCICDICAYCYVFIYKTNRGIFECPKCKYTYGNEVPDVLLEMGTAMLEKKFGIK
jgi:hypothetical protein